MIAINLFASLVEADSRLAEGHVRTHTPSHIYTIMYTHIMYAKKDSGNARMCCNVIRMRQTRIKVLLGSRRHASFDVRTCTYGLSGQAKISKFYICINFPHEVKHLEVTFFKNAPPCYFQFTFQTNTLNCLCIVKEVNYK